MDNLTISRLMRVTLIGEEKDFSIKALSSLDQYIERYTVARGFSRRCLCVQGAGFYEFLISIRFKVEGKDEVYNLPSYEREVHIVVALLHTFGQFIARNWQWIAVTIIIPLIVWIASTILIEQSMF